MLSLFLLALSMDHDVLGPFRPVQACSALSSILSIFVILSIPILDLSWN